MSRRRPGVSSKRAGVLMAWLLASFALHVHADELGEVQGLYHEGRTAAALARADQLLSRQPGDVPMRFMKGVMLADAKRNDEATAVFLGLTQDHPDLVEPYNNLAAVYAANGDYAQARAALESALRARPGFATAHENLGDVYAAMAAQSYARALQLAPAQTSAAPKLALLRQLLAPGSTAGASPAAAPGSTAGASTAPLPSSPKALP